MASRGCPGHRRPRHGRRSPPPDKESFFDVVSTEMPALSKAGTNSATTPRATSAEASRERASADRHMRSEGAANRTRPDRALRQRPVDGTSVRSVPTLELACWRSSGLGRRTSRRCPRAGLARDNGPVDRVGKFPRVPSLATRRLELREITAVHADWYFVHFSRPEIVRGQGFPPPADRPAAQEELGRYVLDPFADRNGFRWGIALKRHTSPNASVSSARSACPGTERTSMVSLWTSTFSGWIAAGSWGDRLREQPQRAGSTPLSAGSGATSS